MSPARRARFVALVCAAALLTPAAAGAASNAPDSAPPPAPVPAPPPTIPPPTPFAMPMDSGPRLVAQRDQANLDILAGEPESARAEAARDDARDRYDTLMLRLASLGEERERVVGEIEASRARLSASAADAYIRGNSDGAAIMQTVSEAEEALDLSRDLHLIGSYGRREVDRYDLLLGQQDDLEDRIAQTSVQRDDAKQQWDTAIARADAVRSALDDARRRLAEAEEGIARFHELASTAGSPILGPNRLTAQQLADFVRASGNTPNITVSIDELAALFIEESTKVGVRGDVAWAQSILETGYFGFRGSMVEPEDNNFAGIGACDSCTRGFRFDDARLGVRAQMQLLRTYTDAELTAGTLPDPLLLPGTLRLGFRGKVKSWWDLTGTWASATDYGIRVYALYDTIVQFAASSTPGEPPAG